MFLRQCSAYFFSVGCLLFITATCFANPGGVGTDLAVWLKADGNVYSSSGVTATDGDTVSEWDNAASTTVEATQSTAGNRPTFRTDRVNGRDAVSFDGTDDFFGLDVSAIKGSNYTLYGVGVRGDGNANYLLGSPGGTANEHAHFGYLSSTTARLGQGSNDLDITVPGYDAAAESPFLLSGGYDSATGHAVSEVRDGVETTGSNTNLTGLSGTAAGYVGRHASDYYDGDIAEVVAYSRALTAAEERRVRSYLALKYGISLRGIQNYVSSDGTVVFAGTTTYSGHNHAVAGIGRDDSSGLDMSESQSANPGSLLRVSNPSSLDDGDFLVWGNNDGTLSLAKESVRSFVSSRIARVWRFHETGDVGTVTVSLDIDAMGIPNSNRADDYVLIVSGQSDFVRSVTVSAASLSDGRISFNSVSLSSGDYVTFGVKKERSTSLGGVMANMRLWLDVSDSATLHTDTACTSAAPANNTDVQCWEDKSGHNSHVTTVPGDCIIAVPGSQTCGVPTYKTNQFGDRPALEFTRSDSETLRHNLRTAGTEWTGNNFSLFIAFEQVGTPGTYYSFFSNGDSAHDGNHFQIDTIDDSGSRRFRVFGLTNQANISQHPIFDNFDNELKLYGVRAQPSLIEVFSDGVLQDSVIPAIQTMGRLFKHYRVNQNRQGNNVNNSKIAEIVLYDTAISNCEIVLVSQYLGLKYHRNLGGGIPGAVDCEDIRFWYNAGVGVTHTANSVSEWGDLGPHRSPATQSTATAQPTLVGPSAANALNSNAAVSFDGSDLLSLTAARAPRDDEARTYFIAVRPDTGAGDGSVLSHGTNANGEKVSLGVTPTRVALDVGGHTYGVNRTASSDTGIITAELGNGDDSDEWEIRIDGSDQTETTISGSSQSVDTGTTAANIGAESFSANRFNGRIGEIFVYGDLLSASERDRVESYLALKYGITLDDTNDYVDSANRVIYESTGERSGYTDNIAGIGRDDAQGLLQTDSRSQNSDAVLSVAVRTVSDIASREFLVWGTDGALTETTNNTPSGVGNRMSRVWSFSETGEVGTVDLEFDLNGLTVTGTQASDFKLIQDSDTTFSSGATVTAAGSFSGNIVSFSDVDIEDGEYLSLGTSTGALSVAILDGDGDAVASPSVPFNEVGRSDSSQTIAGTLGTSSEKITVSNSTGGASWSLSLAASRNTAVWTAGSDTFDFNDTLADGSDADTVGGGLTVNPSAMTITAGTGCDADGLSKGSQTAFSEGSTDTITLITAGSTADTDCSWDITGIGLSQTVPAGQEQGTYSLGMTLTVTAQ